MSKKYSENVEQKNAKVLADLVADPATTDQLRVRIITKLLEAREGQEFHRTSFEEKLSFGSCPCCGHLNHWAIPEEDLNLFHWVTYKQDKEVPQSTNSEICPEFGESCKKKKIVM